MTSKERKAIESSLRKVKKCSGECAHCANCHLYTRTIGQNAYFAFGCDLLPTDMFTYISNGPSKLRQDAIDQLEFELS